MASDTPADLHRPGELIGLVRCAFEPWDIQGPLSELAVPGWPPLHRAVSELARPMLKYPGSRDLLRGYAILLELWMLEDWLAHPEGEGPMEGWEPYRRLAPLADG